MKKIFALAIALIAFTDIASAQTRLMHVNKTDGTIDEYYTSDVVDVTFGTETYGDEDWEEWGVGTYVYDIWWYEFPPFQNDVKENLKIYRHKLHTNTYKIEKWGYDTDTDFLFAYNEDTGHLQAFLQDTGVRYIYDNYEVWVDDLIHLLGEGLGYAESYREGDVFYFALAYYIPYMSNSVWGYTGDSNGCGYETFTITSYVNGAPAKN